MSCSKGFIISFPFFFQLVIPGQDFCTRQKRKRNGRLAGLCQPRLVRAKAGQGDDPPFVGQDGEPLAEMAGKAVVDEQFFLRVQPYPQDRFS